MKYTGKAHCVGDHIDTDGIIPARFLVTSDPVELGKKCMSGLEDNWIDRVKPGDFIVAGKNFGCGSSREHAPISIVGAGMQVVLAQSYARIFYRNAFNTGLIPLEIPEDFKISDNDEITVDMDAATITNNSTGKSVSFPPFPPTMQAILDAGGLPGYVNNRLKKEGKI